MNDLGDLTVIIRSRFPIVTIETHEEPRVLELLERVANLENQALFVWNVTDGLRRRNPFPARSAGADARPAAARGPIPETHDITGALKHIHATPQNGIYVLLDIHPYTDNPVNQRLIKNTAQAYAKTARTIVLVGPKVSLPPDLDRMSARFELAIPDAAAIRGLIKEEAQSFIQSGGADRLTGHQEAFDILVQHLAGMCLDDARRLARQAIRDDGAITMDDISRVLKAKQEMLGANSPVEIQFATTKFSEVAGLKQLKRWLDQRRAAFLGRAASLGLDPPKGLLLVGVQGAGKSLAAKAVAGSWGVPLLGLDFSTLYNKWLGETERNLREALKFADAMAPCVLWMDEIEKGVAVGSSDGGESRRLLGSLLTWMAERKSRVFLVATANDIEQLPPELIRKGRFDEIFFVDLPDVEARAEIFSIHLKRRGLDPEKFDVAGLVGAAEGFSGAEIEQAIVSALYEAHAAEQPVATGHIAAEIERTRPLSVVMAERISALREWAAGRTVMAN